MLRSLVGSEMCIRDSAISDGWRAPALAGAQYAVFNENTGAIVADGTIADIGTSVSVRGLGVGNTARMALVHPATLMLLL